MGSAVAGFEFHWLTGSGYAVAIRRVNADDQLSRRTMGVGH